MSRKRILVVDDDPGIRTCFEMLFQLNGYAVEVAENGREALAILDSCRELPGLILLDLAMPIMDGEQFLEEKQLRPRLAGVTVAVMSASGTLERQRTRLKADYFLGKPLDIDDVLGLIQRHCDGATEKMVGTTGIEPVTYAL